MTQCISFLRRCSLRGGGHVIDTGLAAWDFGKHLARRDFQGSLSPSSTERGEVLVGGGRRKQRMLPTEQRRFHEKTRDRSRESLPCVWASGLYRVCRECNSLTFARLFRIRKVVAWLYLCGLLICIANNMDIIQWVEINSQSMGIIWTLLLVWPWRANLLT